MNVTWIPSPNHTKGRIGYQPVAIVVHIMEGSLSDTDSWFSATQSDVSAHYGISTAGTVHQYVEEGDTAWHCGRVHLPVWALIKEGVNPNLYTLGIEHEGHPGPAWPAAQYDASASLIAALSNRWSIPLDRDHVIRHAEIYALKSLCPGPGVDLDKLIAMARERVLACNQYNVVDTAFDVTTKTAVNIRGEAPTTHALSQSVLSPGAVVHITGWTSNGEAVHGNSHWYRRAEGGYLWAGATDRPTPV